MVRETNKRFAYMDVIRIIAVFLVIVNHTNSAVFQASSPDTLTWWLSIVWYYCSKIGVPLFVMVSGACLLPKVDTYKKAFQRMLRIGIVLVLFSYVYFIVYVLQHYGGIKDVLNLAGFFKIIWQTPITDSYWYLYFYIGLMLMLPWLQRLARTMKKQDMLYFILLSFGLGAVWPLLTHYAPALSMSNYFNTPLFAIYIGIFFTGHYMQKHIENPSKVLCTVVIIISLAASALLTYREYLAVSGTGVYWFMDERTAPSIFIILCAAAVMLLLKAVVQTPEKQMKSHLQTLGGCAFGIYLIQDLLIALTRYSIFTPLANQFSPMVVVLLWEIGIFLTAMLIILPLRKLPGIRKLI